MANDLMKPNTSAETPAERNARILAQVARLKSEAPEAIYTPYEGGVNYVSFNGNDGEFTFGLNKNSIPAGQLFIVPMESVKHGCLEWESKKKIGERLCALIEGPAPGMPAGGVRQGSLAKPRERDGWNPVIVLRLVGYKGELSMIELEFTLGNDSTRQAGANLLAEMLKAPETAAGQEGFFNPVVEVEIKSYRNKAYDKDVYFPVFKIAGWTDGNTVREIGAAALVDGRQDVLADGDTPDFLKG